MPGRQIAPSVINVRIEKYIANNLHRICERIASIYTIRVTNKLTFHRSDNRNK